LYCFYFTEYAHERTLLTNGFDTEINLNKLLNQRHWHSQFNGQPNLQTPSL